MKRLLGTCLPGLVLLLVAVLAGCADSDSSTATDEEPPSSSPSPTQSDPAPSEAVTIAIVSETAAGGEVDELAVSLDDEASQQEFFGQFERGSLQEKILAAIGTATMPEGYTVVGAVVAIGCDVPTGVTASRTGEGWVLDPQMPGKTMQECFAPVTSVALVAVPA